MCGSAYRCLRLAEFEPVWGIPIHFLLEHFFVWTLGTCVSDLVLKKRLSGMHVTPCWQSFAESYGSGRPYVIQIAARSPPGQVPKLLHFQNYLLSFWGASGSLFGVVCSSCEHGGIILVAFSCLKTGLGRQWCPNSRPSDVSSK